MERFRGPHRGSARVTRRLSGRTTFRGWCNRQHNWFWSSYWGFESSPPNQDAGPRDGATDPRPLAGKPPSSSGLGHHPLKVAARVRIPLGVPHTKPLVSSENRCDTRGFGVSGIGRWSRAVSPGHRPYFPIPPRFGPICAQIVPTRRGCWPSRGEVGQEGPPCDSSTRARHPGPASRESTPRRRIRRTCPSRRWSGRSLCEYFGSDCAEGAAVPARRRATRRSSAICRCRWIPPCR